MQNLRSGAVGLFLAVAAIALTAYPANATISDNGWYTTDNGEGLDWADLTLTTGERYNDVINNVATHATYANSGWINAGWEVATRAQVLTFWTNVTGIAGFWDLSYRTEINGATIAISDYVGLTFGTCATGSSGECYSRGHIFEEYAYDYTYDAYVSNDEKAHPDTDYSTTYSTSESTYAYGDRGTWLVRSTVSVPEPGTLLSFAAGLFGLACFRRRQNRPHRDNS